VYKSTQSLNGPWTPIFECGYCLGRFRPEFGLQHEYREDGLLNHATYYYAVTAFSKRDTVTGLPSRESRFAEDDARGCTRPAGAGPCRRSRRCSQPLPHRCSVHRI